MLLALLVLLALLAPGCGKPSADELREQARDALTAGRLDEARAVCDEALAGGDVAADPTAGRALSWQFERMRLEAIARQGDPAGEFLPLLTRVVESYPTQVDAPCVARFAGQLVDGGSLHVARDALAFGVQRFPAAKVEFEAMAARLKEAAEKGGDSALIEDLRRMGYL